MVSTPIKSLASEVSDVMFPEGTTGDIYNEINAVASRQTFNIQYLISEAGEFIIVNSYRHLRLKIIQAWVEVKDNSYRSQAIEIIDIAEPKTISESYKAGVAVPLKLIKEELNFYKSIRVIAKSNRLVTVYFSKLVGISGMIIGSAVASDLIFFINSSFSVGVSSGIIISPYL